MVLVQLDASTIEMLIEGAIEIDDAPPGFGRVAELINKAQGPATARELAAREATVTTFATRVRSRSAARVRTRRALSFPKVPLRVLALAAPIILLGGGVATATGSLPSSAQAAMSRTLSSVGISVPNPQNAVQVTVGSLPLSTGSARARSKGFDASLRSRATVGSCRAWRAGGLNLDSTAYRNLATAAGGAAELPTYCAGASASSSNDATSGHAKRLPGRLNSGQALRRSNAAAGKRATAANKAASTTPGHSPEAQADAVSRVRTGLSSGRGSHDATVGTARTRAHRSRTKIGKEPPGSTSSTGTSAPTSPVESSPVESSPVSSAPVGGGPSKHHGRPRRSRGQRECGNSVTPGGVSQSHHHCRPITTTGSKGTVTSTNFRATRCHTPHRAPSAHFTPRFVKPLKSM